MEVFCDSNVILYHLADKSSSATNLIKRIEKGATVGYINDIVISEVTYGYIRAKTKLKPFELKRKIKSVKLSLTPLKDIFSIFKVLPCKIGTLALEIIEQYKLLPNDALIAATCKYYSIKKIATFDDDFRRVDFLEVIDLKDGGKEKL